jgi:hypothetical protein
MTTNTLSDSSTLTETNLDMDTALEIYTRFESSNNRTLDEIFDLRTAFTDSDYRTVMEKYFSFLNGIREMAGLYNQLTKNVYHKNLMTRLLDIEEKTGVKLETAISKLSFGNNLNFDLYNLIENADINDNHNCFDDCATLHQLIRRMHSSSLEALFNIKDGKVEKRVFNKGSVFIMRYDGNANQGLIKPIIDFYEYETDKEGTEEYRILLLKDKLISRVKMGCHFSYFDIGLENQENASIGIRFYNTDECKYPNAPSRALYVEEVVKRLGFNNISYQNNIITGRMDSIPKNELNNKIFEIIRLFASSKDLDVKDVPIKNNVPMAVEAFFKGIVNIKNYLIYNVK